jgi:hypothetical protein
VKEKTDEGSVFADAGTPMDGVAGHDANPHTFSIVQSS